MKDVPILYIYDTVLFPNTTIVANYDNIEIFQILNYCLEKDKLVFVQLYEADSKKDDSSSIYGTLARITAGDVILNTDNKTVSVTLNGLDKAKMNCLKQTNPFIIAQVEVCNDDIIEEVHESLVNAKSCIKRQNLLKFKSLIASLLQEKTKDVLLVTNFLAEIYDDIRIINYSALLLITDPKIQRILLSLKTLKERYYLLSKLLIKEKDKEEEFIQALKNFDSFKSQVNMQ